MSVVLRDFQANPVAVLVYFRTESIPISGTPAVRPPPETHNRSTV